MASSEGPTAAIAQAVNLSVTEGTDKVQKEPTSMSSNAVSNSTTPVPDNSSENDSKPVAEAVDNNKTPTVKNSTPDIPTPSSTQKSSDSTDNAKPPNGDSNAPAPKTEIKDATKASADAGMSSLESVSDKDDQAKTPETQTTEDPKHSCDKASDKKTNCDNAQPTASQEKAPTTDFEMENVQTPSEETEMACATANGGSSAKTEVPLPLTPTISKPVATIKPMVESMDSSISDAGKQGSLSNDTKTNNKRSAEDSDEPDKRLKTTALSSVAHSSSSGGYKGSGKTPEQILDYMDKSFEHRRKIITKQMPTIPELKELYPDLFRDKQLVIEFQRITKIDIDQKIQEFCVRNATAVIEMARSKKGAQPVLARWEQAKQENEALKQYWDMVTALCLLPLHFGENFVEMVLEIEEDEEVQAQGKIVPTLVARGNIFRTDEFFLIAENTIVQEFEEFTIAFASLYSSYWVFNMVYPETIENTYNFIQRCIVKQKEPGAIPMVCKNFTKTLQKWNKSMKKA